MISKPAGLNNREIGLITTSSQALLWFDQGAVPGQADEMICNPIVPFIPGPSKGCPMEAYR